MPPMVRAFPDLSVGNGRTVHRPPQIPIYPFWWRPSPLRSQSWRAREIFIVSSMEGRHKNSLKGALGLLALITLTPASGAEFYGMLPARDLSPFGFLRLDMRPTRTNRAEPGQWSFETEFATQNTWAMSRGVQDYLTDLESTGRRPLGEAEVAAIRDLPGENYLIDLESTTVDVTLNYQITSHLSGYLITSAVSYDKNYLDGTVERFHHAFGLSSYGRPAIARGGANLIYDLKSGSYASLGRAPVSGGLLDPTIGLRYSNIPLGNAWNL